MTVFFCFFFFFVLLAIMMVQLGLPQRREPSGHNFVTYHLVLVLAAALG